MRTSGVARALLASCGAPARAGILGALGLLVTSASGLLGQEATRNRPQLELREAFSYSVPDSFVLSGVAGSGDSSVIAWSPQQSYLLVYRNGAAKTLDVGLAIASGPIAAAFVEGDSVLEILDATRVLRVSASGSALDERAFDLPVTAVGGARLSNGWVIGGVDSEGDYEVFLLRPNGKLRHIRSIPPGANAAPEDDRLHGNYIHLAEAERRIIATRRDPSFENVVLDSTGHVEMSFRPPPPDSLVGTDQLVTPTDWASLPCVALDQGFIQTLSDLRSDMRVLVLYDTTGSVFRHIVLNAPIGLSARSRDANVLLGARVTDTTEIVGYTWRWSHRRDRTEVKR